MADETGDDDVDPGILESFRGIFHGEDTRLNDDRRLVRDAIDQVPGVLTGRRIADNPFGSSAGLYPDLRDHPGSASRHVVAAKEQQEGIGIGREGQSAIPLRVGSLARPRKP